MKYFYHIQKKIENLFSISTLQRPHRSLY